MGPALPAAQPQFPAPPQESRPVYVVDARLDESALQSVLGALSAGPQRARFAESDEPLPTPAPALSIQAALWWTQPAGSWAPWVSIPVVVDRDGR
jgi:hypothetical protein